tara:strand:- start:524 stop:1513 length:990 start_codon:yes stop_codon:yes gene_type:complete
MYQEKQLKFSTEVNESQVYNILTKNYIEIITDYFELQRIWLNNAYITFKDLDKYFILMKLVSKTFDSYSEYFIKYNFDQFYNVDQYELKKFNILNIANELSISKETARRKILELEKIGIIKKNKKAVIINRNAYNLQKPTTSIHLISKFLANLSRLLQKTNIIKQQISSLDLELLIKNNYTHCWNFFLKFQIEMLTTFKKKFFKDYETVQIWAMIVYNQNLSLSKKIKSSNKYPEKVKDTYLTELLSLTETLGLNAMTISDLTGIPRPTVIRKLNFLVKNRFINKNKNGLYIVSDSSKVKEVDKYRLENVNKISEMSCKLFNAARIYKS